MTEKKKNKLKIKPKVSEKEAKKKEEKKKKKKKLKQLQNTTVRQSVNISISNPSKNNKDKGSTKSSNQGEPKGIMSGQMAYYRQMNAPPPSIIQNLPNNNELLGAIQGILNRNNPHPIPAQVNPELLEGTMNDIQKMSKNVKQRVKEEAAGVFSDDTPFIPRYGVNIVKNEKNIESSNSPISIDIAKKLRDSGKDQKLVVYTPDKKTSTISKVQNVFGNMVSSASKTLRFKKQPDENLNVSGDVGFVKKKEPEYRRNKNNKLEVQSLSSNSWIDAYGATAKKQGTGLHKPPPSEVPL